MTVTKDLKVQCFPSFSDQREWRLPVSGPPTTHVESGPGGWGRTLHSHSSEEAVGGNCHHVSVRLNTQIFCNYNTDTTV